MGRRRTGLPLFRSRPPRCAEASDRLPRFLAAVVEWRQQGGVADTMGTVTTSGVCGAGCDRTLRSGRFRLNLPGFLYGLGDIVRVGGGNMPHGDEDWTGAGLLMS